MSSQRNLPSEQAILKSDLRAEMRKVRRHLDADSRIGASQLIVDKVHNIIVDNAAINVGLYLATTFEVNLDLLIDQCNFDKRIIYLPHLADSQIAFRKFTSWDQIEIGPLNLRHPASQSSDLPMKSFDMIVLPGLAFDRCGNRLGQGGGWYDRALNHLQKEENKPLLMGVCFDEQLVEKVPCEQFDVRMDIVVTPTTIYLN